MNSSSKILASLLVGLVMVACGGRSDEEGSPTKLSVVPDAATFTSPTGVLTCPTSGNAEVFVFGGVAPYEIKNTFPAYMTVSSTVVDHTGGSFTVSVLPGAGCIDGGIVVVIDKLKNQVTFTLTTAAAAS